MRQALSLYQQAEDLIQLGAYVSGSNPLLDAAIRVRPQTLEFLRQAPGVESTRADTMRQLGQLAAALGPLGKE